MAMTERDYLENLLRLCTISQVELFERMYSERPIGAALVRAVTQVENTLYDLNSANESLRYKNKTLKDDLKVVTETLATTRKNSQDDSERLRFLDALEGAGVDNWKGYEDAQDMIEAWNNE